MRSTTPRRLIATATTTGVVAIALLLGACSGTGDAAGPVTTAAATAQGAGTDVSGEHDEADTTFAQMMIVHHEGALEMADLALEKAATDDVRDLAQRIRDAQDPEIRLMSGWLEAWGEHHPDAVDHGGMEHGGMEMDGMSQSEAMASLRELEGVEFDRTFLELMTAHHQGAIEMSDELLEQGTNPEASELARAIIDAQTAEIDEMRGLLAGL